MRALTRIAERSNEAEWLELALPATDAEVEQLVRGYRRDGRRPDPPPDPAYSRASLSR